MRAVGRKWEHAAGVSVRWGLDLSHNRHVSRCSGGLRLEFVQDVVRAAADLARDSQHSALATDTRRSLRVESTVGTVRALGVLSGFDQRPAEHG